MGADEPLTPASLGERFRAGEQEALTTSPSLQKVWADHEKILYRICRHRLKDEQDAQDALALVSLTVLQKLPALQGRVLNVRAWLVQLTKNQCVDIQRHRLRSARLFSVEPAQEDEACPDNAPPLDDQVLERELWAVAGSMIQDLPDLLKDVADLYFIQELSYPEIAEQLHLTQENVRKRVQKARAILREQLLLYLQR